MPEPETKALIAGWFALSELRPREGERKTNFCDGRDPNILSLLSRQKNEAILTGSRYRVGRSPALLRLLHMENGRVRLKP